MRLSKQSHSDFLFYKSYQKYCELDISSQIQHLFIHGSNARFCHQRSSSKPHALRFLSKKERIYPHQDALILEHTSKLHRHSKYIIAKLLDYNSTFIYTES